VRDRHYEREAGTHVILLRRATGVLLFVRTE